MKNTLRLAAILATVFFLAIFPSCQMDDAEHKLESHTGITEKYITQEDLKKMSEAAAIVNKINNGPKSNAAGKNVYNADHDFFVSTDKILRIDNGNYHSLTFPIFRLESGEGTENLVLSSRDDGKYDAALYSYELTAQEREYIFQGRPIIIKGR